MKRLTHLFEKEKKDSNLLSKRCMRFYNIPLAFKKLVFLQFAIVIAIVLISQSFSCSFIFSKIS